MCYVFQITLFNRKEKLANILHLAPAGQQNAAQEAVRGEGEEPLDDDYANIEQSDTTISNGSSANPEHDDAMSRVYDEPYDANLTHEYENATSANPPIYDLPYAAVPSTDPGGFVAIGRGLVTEYNTDEDSFMNIGEHSSQVVAIGGASVVFFHKAAET